ncbi:MAG: GNAT family N-acetyltransferase [Planctomycetota bacterium]
MSSGPYSVLELAEAGDEWNQYVHDHPKGTVFHTRELVEAFANTPSNTPVALAARDESGKVIALLVAVRIATINGWLSRFASRSIYYAEPICDPTDDGIAALRQLVVIHDRRMKSRTLFSEVRAIQAAEGERSSLEQSGYAYSDYLNYVVDTRKNADELFSGLSKSCRSKIKRSLKRGVEIETGSADQQLDIMYGLVQTSYERSGVPLVDQRLFSEALARLGEDVVQVRVARFEGTPVAAGISLAFQGRFYAWYGGGIRKPGIAPFDVLTWDEIRWASENGFQCYDFGGAGWPDEEYGPREFKAKFGGELVSYGRYRKVSAPVALKFAEQSYALLRNRGTQVANKDSP